MFSSSQTMEQIVNDANHILVSSDIPGFDRINAFSHFLIKLILNNKVTDEKLLHSFSLFFNAQSSLKWIHVKRFFDRDCKHPKIREFVMLHVLSIFFMEISELEETRLHFLAEQYIDLCGISLSQAVEINSFDSSDLITDNFISELLNNDPELVDLFKANKQDIRELCQEYISSCNNRCVDLGDTQQINSYIKCAKYKITNDFASNNYKNLIKYKQTQIANNLTYDKLNNILTPDSIILILKYLGIKSVFIEQGNICPEKWVAVSEKRENLLITDSEFIECEKNIKQYIRDLRVNTAHAKPVTATWIEQTYMTYLTQENKIDKDFICLKNNISNDTYLIDRSIDYSDTFAEDYEDFVKQDLDISIAQAIIFLSLTEDLVIPNNNENDVDTSYINNYIKIKNDFTKIIANYILEELELQKRSYVSNLDHNKIIYALNNAIKLHTVDSLGCFENDGQTVRICSPDIQISKIHRDLLALPNIPIILPKVVLKKDLLENYGNNYLYPKFPINIKLSRDNNLFALGNIPPGVLSLFRDLNIKPHILGGKLEIAISVQKVPLEWDMSEAELFLCPQTWLADSDKNNTVIAVLCDINSKILGNPVIINDVCANFNSNNENFPDGIKICNTNSELTRPGCLYSLVIKRDNNTGELGKAIITLHCLVNQNICEKLEEEINIKLLMNSTDCTMTDNGLNLEEFIKYISSLEDFDEFNFVLSEIKKLINGRNDDNLGIKDLPVSSCFLFGQVPEYMFSFGAEDGIGQLTSLESSMNEKMKEKSNKILSIIKDRYIKKLIELGGVEPVIDEIFQWCKIKFEQECPGLTWSMDRDIDVQANYTLALDTNNKQRGNYPEQEYSVTSTTVFDKYISSIYHNTYRYLAKENIFIHPRSAFCLNYHENSSIKRRDGQSGAYAAFIMGQQREYIALCWLAISDLNILDQETVEKNREGFCSGMREQNRAHNQDRGFKKITINVTENNVQTKNIYLCNSKKVDSTFSLNNKAGQIIASILVPKDVLREGRLCPQNIKVICNNGGTYTLKGGNYEEIKISENIHLNICKTEIDDKGLDRPTCSGGLLNRLVNCLPLDHPIRNSPTSIDILKYFNDSLNGVIVEAFKSSINKFNISILPKIYAEYTYALDNILGVVGPDCTWNSLSISHDTQEFIIHFQSSVYDLIHKCLEELYTKLEGGAQKYAPSILELKKCTTLDLGPYIGVATLPVQYINYAQYLELLTETFFGISRQRENSHGVCLNIALNKFILTYEPVLNAHIKKVEEAQRKYAEEAARREAARIAAEAEAVRRAEQARMEAQRRASEQEVARQRLAEQQRQQQQARDAAARAQSARMVAQQQNKPQQSNDPAAMALLNSML